MTIEERFYYFMRGQFVVYIFGTLLLQLMAIVMDDQDLWILAGGSFVAGLIAGLFMEAIRAIHLGN